MPPDARPHPFAVRARALDDGSALPDAAHRHGRERPQGASGVFAETFLVQFLRAPSLVGGIVPSSRVLARALSRHAAGFESIVELGAGAGSVTHWLAVDHPRSRLTVVERDGAMARRLVRRWPRARVLSACVHERADALLAQPARTVAVSSLPFRSLPEDLVRPTVAVIERFLLDDPARRFVQYSYGLRPPFAFASPEISWRRAERIWRNVPPAVVWIATSALRSDAP
ncbi:MAG TPA: hypothetical protein PLM09_08645 [Casimicrobiaceae bacterium]|nr:hypothetical protein [Casimicrobiaceae bacterium]